MLLKDFANAVLNGKYHLLITLFLTGILWGISNSLAPYFLKLIIDSLANHKSALMPGIFYISLQIFNVINFRSADYLKLKLLPVVKQDTAIIMFNHIKTYSHKFFSSKFSGDISQKIDDLVGNIESLVLLADEVMAIIASFIFALVFLFFINHVFAEILVIWLVIFTLITIKYSQAIINLAKERSLSYAKYFGKLVDILSNFNSVRLFARNKYESQNLENSISDLVDKDQATQKYIIKMRVVQDLSILALIASMLYLLFYLYEHSLVSIGDFAMLLMITMSIFNSIWYLASKASDSYRKLGACKATMDLINQHNAITDADTASKLVAQKGRIEFINVTFGYNETNIFQQLSIAIEPGTKIGLVGFSGSGKTSFLNLILRLYDIKSGEILIDEQNIAKVTQASLREKIAMIPQDISLFHRSIYENIAYGNIFAKKSQVISAAKDANCYDFIDQLPDKFDTMVGERGVRLSGGERQRIAIARALLKKAPILLLDEATSALDSLTERNIQASLELAMKNRTTIVVAHRLSTLLSMDRILVFSDGKIIEDGAHKQLIAKKGHYAKLWQMQSNGFIPEQ